MYFINVLNLLIKKVKSQSDTSMSWNKFNVVNINTLPVVSQQRLFFKYLTSLYIHCRFINLVDSKVWANHNYLFLMFQFTTYMFIHKTKFACGMCNVIFQQSQLILIVFHLLVNAFAITMERSCTQNVPLRSLCWQVTVDKSHRSQCSVS